MIQDDKKMVCIKTNFRDTCIHGNRFPHPVKDQIVTLDYSVEKYGIIWYALKEFPERHCGCHEGYKAKCFVPLDKHLEQFSISELLEAPKELELITA